MSNQADQSRLTSLSTVKAAGGALKNQLVALKDDYERQVAEINEAIRRTNEVAAMLEGATSLTQSAAAVTPTKTPPKAPTARIARKSTYGVSALDIVAKELESKSYVTRDSYMARVLQETGKHMPRSTAGTRLNRLLRDGTIKRVGSSGRGRPGRYAFTHNPFITLPPST